MCACQNDRVLHNGSRLLLRFPTACAVWVRANDLVCDLLFACGRCLEGLVRLSQLLRVYDMGHIQWPRRLAAMLARWGQRKPSEGGVIEMDRCGSVHSSAMRRELGRTCANSRELVQLSFAAFR